MKSYVYFLSMLFFSTLTYGQTDQVKIEITNGGDLIYDGVRLQMDNANLIIGQEAGKNIDPNASGNTVLGKLAGNALKTGNNNTIIGENAGLKTLGNGNVLIGYDSGRNETGDEKLYISNSDTSDPLIYGDFRTKTLRVNNFLDVVDDITIGNDAFIYGALNVDNDIEAQGDLYLGGTAQVGLLEIEANNPTLNFSSNSDAKYDLSYQSFTDQFIIKEAGASQNTMEFNEGNVTLPHYQGSENAPLIVDENGKLARGLAEVRNYNIYDFTDPFDQGTYRRYRKGVRLPDGMVVDGIKGFFLDNEPGSNTGVMDTFYGLLRRQSKTDNNAFPEEIFRISGLNTPMGYYQQFQSLAPSIVGGDVIDNDNYIYFLEVFVCNACEFREIVIVE